MPLKGPGTGCGADAPQVTLSVFGLASTTTQYLSDFYSGCTSFDAGSRDFVAFDALPYRKLFGGLS